MSVRAVDEEEVKEVSLKNVKTIAEILVACREHLGQEKISKIGLSTQLNEALTLLSFVASDLSPQSEEIDVLAVGQKMVRLYDHAVDDAIN